MNRTVFYLALWIVGLGLGMLTGRWIPSAPSAASEASPGELTRPDRGSPGGHGFPETAPGEEEGGEVAMGKSADEIAPRPIPMAPIRPIPPRSPEAEETVARDRPAEEKSPPPAGSGPDLPARPPGYPVPAGVPAVSFPDGKTDTSKEPESDAAVKSSGSILESADALVPAGAGSSDPTRSGSPEGGIDSAGSATPIRAVPVEAHVTVAPSGSAAGHTATPVDPPGPDNLAPRLDPEFLNLAGRRIWKSECNGTKAGLTSWNAGEDFASVGIGHFLWYPEGKTFRFEQSFPGFLAYYQERAAKEKLPAMPAWLAEVTHCPWKSRSEFLGSADSPKMVGLREFLFDTFAVQVEFIYQRLLDSREVLFAVEDPALKARLAERFEVLTKTPEGRFAMMDYVNFKGDGTKPEETYQGEGWGLRQVLGEMKPGLEGRDAVADFARASEAMLRRRVKNNPPDERWMAGWASRTGAYALPFQGTATP